ncbi:acyl-CoA dehydrogenase family protein [Litorisediminicola beolgyonensis]|uniref:Acyl-CoA dehydrogenase family protein n=1 Tax=Litorisediminicola beolgyonensis TaxID=1173614 RepID=A0ABW3ZJL6_9RHOB
MSDPLILTLLFATPAWQSLAADAGLEPEDCAAILDEASRLAEDILAPLGATADAEGARLENGRVILPDGHREAWRLMAEGGWLTADLDENLGGMGLPTTLHVAASLGFEGAAMPFMMAAGASRAGAHCLAEAAPDLARDWAPRVASGDWALTICISEPDAGSDVGRIRTKAEPSGEDWTVRGTKCWISFGDHDLTTRIGHLMLARTGAPEDGTRGLSLFLVPDRDEDGTRAPITVERIEEKLGLHGSPTCVLSFDKAPARMIGGPGEGLRQLFTMIELMRLQTSCQGAGVSLRAAALARRYAGERLQGGRPDAKPLPLTAHPDIRRQVATLEAESAILTAAVLEAAATFDHARRGTEGAQAKASWILPLVKTFGGETAFETASGTVQVLSGAGYTREWPAERYLRDARIITIYEGTTGMQGQDFLMRRLLKDEGAGLKAFAEDAAAERAALPPSPASDLAETLIGRLEALSDTIKTRDTRAQLYGADGYLRAGWLALSAQMAARLAATGAQGAALAQVWGATAEARMARAEAQALADPAPFDALFD